MQNDKIHTWGYKLFKPILGNLFRFYYNPTIINKEYMNVDGPVIFISNHKHIMDQCSIIISTKRVINYMAKDEYFKGKFAWFFTSTGCISVDREAHDGVAKNIAINVLKNNGAIGMFPEGTRIKVKDKLLLDFKYGAVSIAKKTNAIIIPCAISGDYVFRSKNLMVRFGKPIVVKENDDLVKTTKKIHDIIENLLLKNLKATKRSKEEEMQSHMGQ